MFHLPDLPNAGYSSNKQKELSDSIMNFIRQIERDRRRMLMIVIEGRAKWRHVAGQIWRGLPLDTDFSDAVFTYLALMSVKPPHQPALLAAVKNTPKFTELLDERMPEMREECEALEMMEKWGPAKSAFRF